MREVTTVVVTSEPSPDFKGIKTRPTRRLSSGTLSEPSPDFKGIKTAPAAPYIARV
ncbi:hypothetical protein [Tepidimonas sp.]|uniref:hypothetical protein n=1 Tax=Tepidimonas sp. TaxID=2002775 RepID=UPI00391D6D5B